MGINSTNSGKGWLVFVESNTTGTGRLFASCALACGYRPVILTNDPRRYPYIEQDRISCVVCATASLPAMRQELQALAGEAAICGIFSSSEYWVEHAAALAREWDLPGADPKSLKTCRNKASQRCGLRAAELITPRFAVANSIQAAMEALQIVQLPTVLKPTQGSGSVGVKLCRTPEEVREHAGFLLQQTVNERGMLLLPEVLMEQYVAGDEFSVETLGGNIVGITRKHVSREPFFVETGHDFPAEIPPETQQEITATVQHALRHTGLAWGPAHVELRLTPEGPVIIEINPRLAGGFIPEIVSLALGVNMIKETLKMVVGAAPEIRFTKAGYASIRFLIPEETGVIAAIHGVDEAWKVEGVSAIQLYRNAGDTVELRHDFRDRIGHVIACGRSESQTAQCAERARKRITVEIKSQ